jgi:hypothetical protein
MTSTFLFRDTICSTPDNVFDLQCVSKSSPLYDFSFWTALPLFVYTGTCLGVTVASYFHHYIHSFFTETRTQGDNHFCKMEKAFLLENKDEPDFKYITDEIVERAWDLFKHPPKPEKNIPSKNLKIEAPDKDTSTDNENDNNQEQRENDKNDKNNKNEEHGSIYVSSHTRVGNIMMSYNHKEERFHYWCKSTPNRQILESVARKYVSQTKQYDLYLVPKNLIDYIVRYYPDPNPTYEDEDETSELRKTSDVSDPKDKINKKQKEPKEQAEPVYDSNVFLYKGTLADLEMLQTKTYSDVKPKAKMSFMDYIKMTGK